MPMRNLVRVGHLPERHGQHADLVEGFGQQDHAKSVRPGEQFAQYCAAQAV